MPILDVEIVTDTAPAAGLAGSIAQAAAEVLGAAPGTLWVRLRHLAPAMYAENAPANPAPVFVSVLKRAAPDDAAGEHFRLAAALAAVIGVAADSVHITYEPPAAGRQSFGGKFVA